MTLRLFLMANEKIVSSLNAANFQPLPCCEAIFNSFLYFSTNLPSSKLSFELDEFSLVSNITHPPTKIFIFHFLFWTNASHSSSFKGKRSDLDWKWELL